jgi:hypothetical protein
MNIKLGLVIITALFLTFLACKKENLKSSDSQTENLIQVYEEIGNRHNDYLSRSFTSVKNKLSNKSSRASRLQYYQVTEEEMHDIVLEVSSEELIPVIGTQYTEDQILNELQNNMPQDLTMESYSSTSQGINVNVPELVLTSTFNQALNALDVILEQGSNYSDSTAIFNSLEQLRNQYEPLLTNLAEKEAFIAGTILAKHSLRYWSVNEQWVNDMFVNYTAARINQSARLTPNPVRADVRGMIIGGVRGAIQGGIWGSAIPGIGTAWGAISMGILGAGASGCTSSLAAGIWNAIFN